MALHFLSSMSKEIVVLDSRKIIGLQIATNFHNEADPKISKITPLVTKYITERVEDKIESKVSPGVLIAGYKDYEGSLATGVSYEGSYTYFVGAEVDNSCNIGELVMTEIPAGTYVKFTTSPGAMPEVIIRAWQEIWAMNTRELGGTRTFMVDFEVYDERARDPGFMVIDIYIGINIE